MTTVAIDIQPQFRFTCMAANANHFLHQPENMVKELNRQASIADKRILVENVNIDPESICAAVVKRNGIMFAREGGYFSQCAGGCRGANLLDGLPASADYDHVIELGGENGFGACFHDDNEARSTGLIEWLYAQKADTVIIGGLATEEAISRTAEQLLWYNDSLHIIRKSFNVAIIGNMIRNLPYTDARNNARNCVRNISGSFNEIRIARYPKNGFISCGNGKYGNSLSPPISIVRTTTGFPFMPSKTAL